ncbi:hypothetical protein J6590_000514 [Homalodisca vitripennis]|nr:hypothetical protein J6590_000514 [Homalodisca vitripennis]
MAASIAHSVNVVTLQLALMIFRYRIDLLRKSILAGMRFRIRSTLKSRVHQSLKELLIEDTAIAKRTQQLWGGGGQEWAIRHVIRDIRVTRSRGGRSRAPQASVSSPVFIRNQSRTVGHVAYNDPCRIARYPCMCSIYVFIWV